MRMFVWVGVAMAASASIAQAGELTGVVVQNGSRRPWVGLVVTAVPEEPGTAAPATTLTGADGSFTFELPPGAYVVTVLGEPTKVLRAEVKEPREAVRSYVVLPAPPPRPNDDDYEEPAQPAVPLEGRPTAWSTRHDSDTPLVRRHDHLGTAALDARIMPATSVTTVAGAARLPGAPPIVAEFTRTIWSQPFSSVASRPGARGGQLDVELATGTDRPGASFDVDLGPEARFAATSRSPREDDVWFALGVAGARDALAPPRRSQHDVQLFQSLGVGSDGSRGTAVTIELDALETWASGHGRDLWGDARVVIRTADHADTLAVGITAEALRPVESATQPAVSRLAGRIELGHRWRGGGSHTTVTGGEVGLGNAGAEDHGDLRGYLGDTWTIGARWILDGSVRVERRDVGTARVDALLPRLAVQWNPLSDRTAVLASIERIARLDETYLGDWRTAPSLGFDQASLGAFRDLGRVVRATLLVRARREIETGATTAAGVEGAIAWLPWHGFSGTVTATSLDRTIAAHASYRWRRFTASAITRITRDDRTWGAAARMRLRRTGDWASIGIELFDLDDATDRSGRISFGAEL